MSLNVLCPACGKTMSVPESYAGRRVKCPNCASVIQIPGAIVAKVVRPTAPEPLDNLLDEQLAAGPALPTAPRPAAAPAT